MAEAAESVTGLIRLLGLVASSEKCIDDTITNAISIKSKELYDKHVTTSFKKQFNDELIFLEPTRLQVELQARGEKGGARFSLKVTGAGKHQVSMSRARAKRDALPLPFFSRNCRNRPINRP